MALDKEKTLQTAQKYLDKSQYAKAIAEFKKVLEVAPDDIRVLLRLAPCYESNQNIREAGETYIKVANLYRNEGAYQKALAVLKQAQKCLPESDEVMMNMAELNYALGLPHEAIALLERCLAHFDAQKNPAEYMQILQMMIRVDSENIQTRLKYAEFLNAQNDRDNACRQYTLALAQLLSKERYVDYIQTARIYLTLMPKDLDVLENLAKIYIRMNKHVDAIALLKVLGANERTSQIHELLITCYTKLGRYTEAVNELKALARQYDDEGARYDVIEDVWRRAQKLAPRDPDVIAALSDEPPLLANSAINLVSTGNDAARRRAQSMQLEMPHPSAEMERVINERFEQAVGYFRIGRVQEARTCCLQIIENNEQHLPALQLLAQIYEQMGDVFSLAQVERKLAKAVFDTDPEAAVRHVLRAEQCTPNAWENYNLMLVFGLDPARYGMSAPNASANAMPAQPSRPSSLPPVPNSPRVPPQRMASDPVSPSQVMPVVQASAPAQRPGMPPVVTLNRTNGVDVSDAGAVVSEEISGMFDRLVKSPSSQQVPSVNVPRNKPPQVPGRQPPRMNNAGAQFGAQSGMIPVAGAAAVQPPPVQFGAKSGMISVSGAASLGTRNAPVPPSVPRYPSQIQASVPSGNRQSSALKQAAYAGVPQQQAYGVQQQQQAYGVQQQQAYGVQQQQGYNVPPQQQAYGVQQQGYNVPPQQQAYGVQQQQGYNVPPQQQAYGVSPQRQGYGAPQQPGYNMPPAVPSRASAQMPSVPAGLPPARRRVPSVVAAKDPSLLEHPSTNTANPPSSQVNPVVAGSGRMPPVPMHAGIPAADRQRVMDAIQEIDFYASMMLMDDARNMLQSLINEFGDIDVIHDARLRLEAIQ